MNVIAEKDNRKPQLLTEAAAAAVYKLFIRFRVPFMASLLFGLAAHGYALTNKLLNADEIEALFGKGATVTSGRWGLELIKVFFPDYSLPWLWGIISLLLLAVSVCLIVDLFQIHSRVLQGLLGGIIVTFPSQTGTFCFMFTSTAYAVSFLLAVLAVWLFCRSKWVDRILGGLCLVFSLSLYQSYLAITASLFLLLVLQALLERDCNMSRTIRTGFSYIAYMICALAVYFAVTYAVFAVTGETFNDYSAENRVTGLSLFGRLRTAYIYFIHTILYRENALIVSNFSKLIHLILFLSCGAELIILWTGIRRTGPAILCLVLLLLLPLSVNCMYLAMSHYSIHTLVLYSFTAVYILAVILTDRSEVYGISLRRVCICCTAVCLLIIILCNTVYANKVYLKLYLEREEAHSYYTTLTTRIEMTEGYDGSQKIMLAGSAHNGLWSPDTIDLGYFTGAGSNLYNIYSTYNYLRYYIGVDWVLADSNETKAFMATEEYRQMPEYPTDGSIVLIEDTIVVKLGQDAE